MFVCYKLAVVTLRIHHKSVVCKHIQVASLQFRLLMICSRCATSARLRKLAPGFGPMIKAIERQLVVGCASEGKASAGKLVKHLQWHMLCRKARFAVESGQDSNSAEAQSAGFPAQCTSIIAWSCATLLDLLACRPRKAV